MKRLEVPWGCSRATRRRWSRQSVRCPVGTRRSAVPERHLVLGTPLAPPFPDGLRAGRVRHGLLLGRGAQVLADRRRVHDRRRLRRRLHAQPDLRGGVLGTHRAHRGGARRVRSGPGLLRAAAGGLLRGPRPDAGDAPGQRRRDPVPVGDLHVLRRPAACRGRRGRSVPRRTDRRPATGRSPPRYGRPEPSTTPSATTSSIWPRTRTATAASGGPG